MRPTLALQLPTYASYGRWLSEDWRRLLDLARAAEDAGVDRLVYVDHVVMGRRTEQYTWGTFAVPPDAPWLECLTTLGAIAAVTSRVRLSTRILIAPLRPAALLAKTAATIDALSHGRLDLGVGVGWQKEEFDALGLDFTARGRLLTETIATCRALWSRTPASVTSPGGEPEDIFCAPLPVQDRLPVWFGGVLHPRNLRRITELGDGWIPIMTAGLEDVRAGAEQLQATGTRPPGGRWEVSASALVGFDGNGRPDVAATIESVPALVRAGATDIHVSLGAVCRDPERATRAIPEIVARFADAVG
jgi:probable F420-dependent oxidoreductase